MKICTPKQMQQIDYKAIEGLGIPGLELMENAGWATYEMLVDYYGPVKKNRVAIICGKGNNGGDGYVIARYLHENGAQAEIFLLCKKDAPAGDATVNLEKAEKLGIPIHEINDANNFYIPEDTWVIIDAIFGTGFSGDIRSPYSTIIDRINDSGIPVVAVDAPSGLDSETGKVSQSIVKADLTVTFGLPKTGQVLYPGKSYCGSLEVVDIGFPPGLDDDIDSFLIDADHAALLLPKREPNSHKGNYGKLFVLAGSTGMTGAAAMTSQTALRCGTGLVVLGCPSSLNQILETKLTEVMTKPLPDVRKRGCFALRGMGEIREQINWADAVAIGPGIGTHHETVELVSRLVKQVEKPMVIDADGLNIVAKNPNLLKQHKGPLVISPHPGEFSRLSGVELAEISENRLELAKSFAKEYNLIIILKGAPSVVAEPSGKIFINYSGNEGMATAGSGDILTGLIGGFLAQGLNTIDSAVLATFTHGLAGDLAAEIFGTRGLIAGDILDNVPEALLELENIFYENEEDY